MITQQSNRIKAQKGKSRTKESGSHNPIFNGARGVTFKAENTWASPFKERSFATN
jgi:hypothetical protein